MEKSDMAIQKQEKNTQINYSFPDHLVEEVLLKLPPKSLLRFKCLSKSAHDTISSPFFSRAHLQKHETNPFLTIVSLDGQILSTLGIENESGHIDVLTLEEHMKIPPILFGLTNIHLESSCNGILCVRTGRKLVLWNPSIRKHKLLTLPIMKDYAVFGFGIGYDPSADDYKIIRISKKLSKSSYFDYYEVEVFTLKSNQWRRLSYDLPYNINILKRPVSVKGVMYWVARLELKQAILCFDLANETFSTVDLPPIERQGISGLMEHESKLGCFCRIPGSSRYDVWIMEEDQTWVRLITISNKLSWPIDGDMMVDNMALGSPDVDTSLKTKIMNLKLLSSHYNTSRPNFCCTASLINLD